MFFDARWPGRHGTPLKAFQWVSLTCLQSGGGPASCFIQLSDLWISLTCVEIQKTGQVAVLVLLELISAIAFPMEIKRPCKIRWFQSRLDFWVVDCILGFGKFQEPRCFGAKPQFWQTSPTNPPACMSKPSILRGCEG